MDILVSAILFIGGLAILIKGSDFFITGAAYMAKHFGVSELIIGLTLVSMGTSLPEFGASVYASATGAGGIAVGNVVGSNVANIALVLGVCLLITNITVKKKMLKRDGLVMIVVSLLFIIFVITNERVELWEGIVLMVIFAAYIIYLYKQNRDEKESEALSKAIEESIEKDRRVGGEIAKLIIDKVDGEDEKEIKEEEVAKPEENHKYPGFAKEITKLTVGCLMVIIGAWLLVEMAVDISKALGISQTVIGSTLVAFGTSVPELAVSVVAILKRFEQISIGNIIGSNIFNILWVIGAAALVGELSVDYTLLYINIPIMLMVAAILLIFMASGKKLMRWQGAVFVAIYGAFLILNYW
jgi:cation:H+ antiporter